MIDLIEAIMKPQFIVMLLAFVSLAVDAGNVFSMRRKQLGRSLKGLLTAEQIASVGIEPTARPETLAPADFARLADLLPAA